MDCPHLSNGRCGLAETLAFAELDLVLEVRPNEVRCDHCQRRGPATESDPGVYAIGAVTSLVCGEKQAQWKAFVDAKTAGQSRGFGDRVSKTLEIVGITKQRASKVAKAVGLKGCGCGKAARALNKLLPHRSPITGVSSSHS